MKYKTPLRYPGGKSRAIKFLSNHLPTFESYREPFLGGGSMALYVTQTFPRTEVWVNDLYMPLYAFWKVLRDQGQRLSDDLRELKTELGESPDAHREAFDNAKLALNANDEYSLAFNFYVINKCSFSGLSESSSFSEQASRQNFTFRGIDRLPYISELIQYWKITNLDYSELLYGNQSFVFLDPPYDIKDNLYGKKGNMHKGFDHELFAAHCCNSEQKCMITYNSDIFVKERFPGWYQKDWDLTYTMRSTGTYNRDQKERKELLLLNYETVQPCLDGLFEVDQRNEE
jgi:site-specific DNA-adenine methylase